MREDSTEVTCEVRTPSRPSTASTVAAREAVKAEGVRFRVYGLGLMVSGLGYI